MQARADKFLAQGVTTLEVKSGYGLDLESEIKCLRAASQIKGPRIVRTFLGPHAKAPEFKDINEYFETVLEKILPRIAEQKLADRVDIFIEKGFFSAEQGEKYFKKAKSLGLDITAHVEQLSNSGGTRAALQFEACSVDHLVEIDTVEREKLAKSQTVAVLLPTSDFYLKISYPPARELIDQGACVALSTDFNPGTSPTQDLSFVGILARVEMKMALPEVLSAWTFGAAKALKMHSSLGSLEVGKQCDFIILDASWRELFYSVGSHPIRSVWRNCQKVFEKKF
jgi:imidazolonepropionase